MWRETIADYIKVLANLRAFDHLLSEWGHFSFLAPVSLWYLILGLLKTQQNVWQGMFSFRVAPSL